MDSTSEFKNECCLSRIGWIWLFEPSLAFPVLWGWWSFAVLPQFSAALGSIQFQISRHLNVSAGSRDLVGDGVEGWGGLFLLYFFALLFVLSMKLGFRPRDLREDTRSGSDLLLRDLRLNSDLYLRDLCLPASLRLTFASETWDQTHLTQICITEIQELTQTCNSDLHPWDSGSHQRHPRLDSNLQSRDARPDSDLDQRFEARLKRASLRLKFASQRLETWLKHTPEIGDSTYIFTVLWRPQKIPTCRIWLNPTPQRYETKTQTPETPKETFQTATSRFGLNPRDSDFRHRLGLLLDLSPGGVGFVWLMEADCTMSEVYFECFLFYSKPEKCSGIPHSRVESAPVSLCLSV